MKFLQIIILSLSITSIKTSHIVEIENGKIEGEENENFYAFKGIRYAIAERFSIAKPVYEKWNNVRKFDKFDHECTQYDHFSYDFLGDEDCLNLNVYVPKNAINDVEPAPVIFFIHGGAFTFGTGKFYDPENIMENGKIILVTINYRLGILGFLSTEDEVLPGNLGMKDQVEALKWVQRNIRAFNGDPDKVTIAGFSAGGASVQLHYMSDLTNNLFKNGISHSGAATNTWVLIENAREKAHKVAEYAKCPFDDHQKMLKCLKEKPVEELTVIAKYFQPFLYNPFTPFGIVVEPKSEHAFLTAHPYEILESGNFKKLPWLLSLTKDEGSYPSAEFYSDEEILKDIEKRWEELAPHILDFDSYTKNDDLKREVSKKIKKFYMNDSKILRKNFQSFNDIITDRLFKSDAKKSYQVQSKFSPSYMYYFQYKSIDGLGEFMSHTNDNLGISHGEDLLMIFKTIVRTKPFNEEDKLMIKNLIDMWYSFSVTNVPTFNGFKIERSTSKEVKCLEIYSSNNFEMIELNEKFGEVSFWNDIERTLKEFKRSSDEF